MAKPKKEDIIPKVTTTDANKLIAIATDFFFLEPQNCQKSWLLVVLFTVIFTRFHEPQPMKD